MFSTQGIILNHVKYSETSIIVHVYTSLFGRQSYMVNGVRRSRSKGKAIFLQPLTLMQMEVTHHEKKEIHRITDYKVLHPFVTIPFNQTKRSITFFITEVLSKVLREEHPNDELFNFVFHAIKVLDEEVPGLPNFHLFFLFQLSRFLGFGVSYSKDSSNTFFDLQNSEYTSVEPNHPYFIKEQALRNWIILSKSDASRLNQLKLKSNQRRDLLNALVLYYELHILNFSSLKSLDVLQALFDA
jgi:DNA repair protein RecO (recombination protein O)